jgi:hypothetical protein
MGSLPTPQDGHLGQILLTPILLPGESWYFNQLFSTHHVQYKELENVSDTGQPPFPQFNNSDYNTGININFREDKGEGGIEPLRPSPSCSQARPDKPELLHGGLGAGLSIRVHFFAW